MYDVQLGTYYYKNENNILKYSQDSGNNSKTLRFCCGKFLREPLMYNSNIIQKAT